MPQDKSLVLTPTARLARAEQRRLAQVCVDQGLAAWRTPEVLSLSVWLACLRDDYFLASDDPRVPISSSQALVLWQHVIDRDIFIGEPRVAELAQAAWRLIHEHQLAPPDRWERLWMSEDNRRFAEWSARYLASCAERNLVDEWVFLSELPGLIERGCVALPPALTLLRFDLPLTPLQQRILTAAEQAGCRVLREPTTSRDDSPQEKLDQVTCFVEPDDELRAAARWARARLEQDQALSIAIVVPDLKDRLERVESLLRQEFDPPGFALDRSAPQAWHVSLGHPLSDWPLVDDILLLLNLDPWRIEYPQAGRLLRSPFLAGWDEEQYARGQVLAHLTRFGDYYTDARELAHLATRFGAETMAGRLAAWQGFRRKQSGAVQPSDWAGLLQEELSSLGFGRGRGLDSIEFQTLRRWHDLLESFSQFDIVTDRPLSRARALRLLGERARAAVFRERNPGAPVEVLGVEEALGSNFDAMWVTSLHAESWPRPARRDPLIPGPVQTAVPAANAAGCLALAKQQLACLLSATARPLASFAATRSEQPLEVTPLLAGVALAAASDTALPEPAALEMLDDDSRAPALPGGSIRGGTTVLQNQSDCPFKAFATQRLHAVDLSPPRPGLDAGSRGSLLHRALEAFWSDVPDHNTLSSFDESGLDERIRQAVETALEEFGRQHRQVLGSAGRELEAQCLQEAMRRWLSIEIERDGFRVEQLEAPVGLRFGELELSGKIDRIDELEGGGAVLIDYKTGQSGARSWAPDDRLADVQLPAYAVSMSPPPAAIAFARIRPDIQGFDGLAEVDAGMAGVDVIGRIKRQPFREIESWQALLADWRNRLDALAAGFQGGHAAVDPRAPSVCRYCHLSALCRIHERHTLTETVDD